MKKYCLVLTVVDPDNRPSKEILERIMRMSARAGILITRGIPAREDEVAIKTEKTDVDT